MKKLLISLFALLPLISFCQNYDAPNTNKIAIGLTYSPDYCYRNIKTDTSYQWLAEWRNDLEIPKYGYTTGLNLALNFNKRFALELGILFSNKGEKTKKYDMLGNQPDPDLPTNITFIYHLLYLDIPIKVNYFILTQRTKLFILAGLSPSVFLTQKITSIAEYSDGSIKTNTSPGASGFSKINLTFIAGFGVSYDLTKIITLKIEPTYRRSITPIFDALVKEYLYSMGLNTGFFFNFKSRKGKWGHK